jgi:hypothetical protein
MKSINFIVNFIANFVSPRLLRPAFALPIAALLLSAISPASAQNVIESDGASRTVAPLVFTLEQTEEILSRSLLHRRGTLAGEAARVAKKLERHVLELIEDHPFRPFHHTLGISGYESYFAHPDELFHSLSIALPYLSDTAAARTREFLEKLLAPSPPYAVEGFDSRTGANRESYSVPEPLRLNRSSNARSAFGVYSFWAYIQHTGSAETVREHWPAIKTRMQPLLETDYKFDLRKTDYTNDEAEKLNGDLAGLIGFVRLARLNQDPDAEQKGLARARQLFELRINLERVNPRILERTRFSSKTLHIAKLARYCGLVPEIGEAVRRHADGCGEERLQFFRQARNSWHLAYGDRLIGGENYTNPPHFVRALFGGAALIEQLPGDQMLGYIDIPWCKGDLYFIEQCAYALWSDAGRSWTR